MSIALNMNVNVLFLQYFSFGQTEHQIEQMGGLQVCSKKIFLIYLYCCYYWSLCMRRVHVVTIKFKNVKY